MSLAVADVNSVGSSFCGAMLIMQCMVHRIGEGGAGKPIQSGPEQPKIQP